MTTQSITSIADGQKTQIIRVCEDAARKAASEAIDEALATKDLAQCILAAGDKLQADLKQVVGQFICKISGELRKAEDRAAEKLVLETTCVNPNRSDVGSGGHHGDVGSFDSNDHDLNVGLKVYDDWFDALI